MEIDQKLEEIKYLVDLLDNKFKLLGVRFGLDPIIGVIPILGDLIPLALSLYIIKLALDSKASPRIIRKMILYTSADVVLGLFPIIGDAADFAFRSHHQTYNILKRYIDTFTEQKV